MCSPTVNNQASKALLISTNVQHSSFTLSLPHVCFYIMADLIIACMSIDICFFFSILERARCKVAGCQRRAKVLAEASSGSGKSSTSY